MEKFKRNSNIEVLRIISMLMIVAFHSMRMGYLDTERSFIVRATGTIAGSWGILGVDLFLLISVWFLVDQRFRIKRVISIVFHVFTYIIASKMIVYILFWLNTESVSSLIKKMIRSFEDEIFQPFWANSYWFVTAYLFMLIISPLMNQLLGYLEKSKIKKVLIIFAFIPVYAQFSTSIVCDIMYFSYFYLLVGYYKRYYMENAFERNESWIKIVFLFIVILSSKFLIMNLDESGMSGLLRRIVENTTALTDRHSLIIMILAWQIFSVARKRKPFYSKGINIVSGATFGVYLFHENPFFRAVDHIFSKLTDLGFIVDGKFFPIQFLASVVLVFTLGIIIEFIRERLIQKPFNYFLDKKYKEKLNIIDNWFSVI